MTYKNIYIFLLSISTIALSIFIYFNFSHSIISEVIISDTINEFIDQVDKIKVNNHKKLVVIDIDDTLLQAQGNLGTPTWFYTMVNKLRQKGASKAEAHEIMSKIDQIVQEQIDIQSIDEAIILAIKSWQKKKSLVIGITSRSSDFINITNKQLKTLQIDFDSNLFSCVENNWSNSEQGVFSKGILYVKEGFNKGEIFANFFNMLTNTCGVSIDLIAQADDQEHYIKQISSIAESHNTNYLGIIYGKAITQRIFALTKANEELKELEKKLNLEIIPKKYEMVFNE